MSGSDTDPRLPAAALRELWPALSDDERIDGFRLLEHEGASEFFLGLPTIDQAELIRGLPPVERRLWLRTLPPDDAADLLQAVPSEERDALLDLLDDSARSEVRALLAYAEDDAGGLMSPRFVRLRTDMSVVEAFRYVRQQVQTRQATSSYAYVLDPEQRLVGVASFRELFIAPGDRLVRDVMRAHVVSVPETMDQEAVARTMAAHRLNAIPVVDEAGRMKGVVTADDIVEVVQEEATEDMQKVGGMAALDTPYLHTGFGTMLMKRAGWLAALFIGEMLTASAMGHYQEEIGRAVVLALFVPLIISSGGNSGSQATTLVIRAMALGEVRMRDAWRVARRELSFGLSLGLILAAIGVLRILGWQAAFGSYGEHATLVAMTVGISLIGVVAWGTLTGSMLPLVLRWLGFDPASASAPFVATLVDVSGLVIYFSVAGVVLRGTLL